MPLDLSKLTRKARWRRPILSPTVAHHSTLIGSSLSLSLSRTINSRTTHTVLLSLFLLAVFLRYFLFNSANSRIIFPSLLFEIQ